MKVTSKFRRSTYAGRRSLAPDACQRGRVFRSLISGVALAALLTGTVAAKADDSDVGAQIKELKAQIRALEKRVDQQQRTVSRVVIRQAQVPAYEPPHPWDKKFYLNGITITPGGFLAMEGVYRTRDQGADIGDTPFGGIPLLNNPLAHMNELRLTARQSRVSTLIQGNVNPSTVVSGYYELDFLGSANSANSNESNSYNPRIRHIYATVDWNDIGFHILAGQTWSLATLQGKGITPRDEITPLTIDAQYVAGFTWARQPGIRLTKNFGDDVWLAASAEMPQTPGCASGTATSTTSGFVAPSPPIPGISSITCKQTPIGGGLLDSDTTYSINHVPDIIAKGVWEPTVADRRLHLGVFGLYRDFYDRITYTSGATTNTDTAGWGVGGDIIVPVMPKFIDLTGSALWGRGIGRYGAGGLSDVTFNPDGTFRALPEAMFLAGVTVHATPQLELYANGGGEKILSPEYFPGYAGYGNPADVDNTGCFTEFGTCTGVTKDVWEITGGFWDKIYQGNFGSVRFGMQYAYIKRDLEPGTLVPGGGHGPLLGGSTDENAIYASFRYYPFDPPPAAPPLAAKY
ncbi:MAG: hypothetical protein WBD92_02110 [Methylovirgula sp.]